VIVGQNVQLAWELNQGVSQLCSAISIGRPELSLSDLDSVWSTIRALRTLVLINAAAYNQETDEPAPLNVYGAGKLAGEHPAKAAGGDYLMLRTSWVYGSRGKNFLNTILGAVRLELVHRRLSLTRYPKALCRLTSNLAISLPG